VLGWIFFARYSGMDGSWAALAGVFVMAAPMLIWSFAVDKVHHRPTTGISRQSCRTSSEGRGFSIVKLAGLWVTWATIGGGYALTGFYMAGDYRFAMEVFMAAGPLLVLVSVPYVLWIDRRLIDPKDGAWHFGAWMMGVKGWEAPAIKHHFRSWAVKAFFLAFMLSILPGTYARVVGMAWADITASSVNLVGWLISLLFVIDIMTATLGYVLTMRPLDAHIRSAEPSLAGWVAALSCYPPFALIGPGRAIDYRAGTMGEESWTYWLSGHPVALAVWGGLLVLLVALYAWATLALGLRFSNLTHRGILTHGPYALFKHPAYLAKNCFWWLACLPFLVTTGSLMDAARNVAGLLLVNALYYWRARTEEMHLSADPDYRAYAAWMAAHGPVARTASAVWVLWQRWRGKGRSIAA
jgi:hypothetical protein